jgi:hypothetical protein
MAYSALLDAINTLNELDLSSASYENLATLFDNIGQVAILEIPIAQGEIIARTRCEINIDNIRYPKDISFISDPSRVSAARANIKGMPVFYGAILMAGDKGAAQVRAVSYSETSKIFADDSIKNGSEYAVTGFWEVKEPFKAVALVHHNEFKQPNPEIAKIRKVYDDFIIKLGGGAHVMHRVEEFKALMNFLSDQFAKPVPYNKPYLYMISNYFAQLLFGAGYDAIVFPSVKGEGIGFNIAITPTATNKFLRLDKVLVNNIEKRGKKSVADNYLLCEEFGQDGAFIWKKMRSAGRESIESQFKN